MPVVMVANTMAGPAVFFDQETNVQIEWGGNGDEQGNDIQPCPTHITENANFQKALQRGIFEIVTEEEANKRFALQRSSWEARMEHDAHAADEFIEQTRQNDTLALQCVGPSQQGGRGRCREQVMIRDRDREDKPPLCSRHAHLRSEFIPVPDPDGRIGDNGKVAMTWIRASAE